MRFHKTVDLDLSVLSVNIARTFIATKPLGICLPSVEPVFLRAFAGRFR